MEKEDVTLKLSLVFEENYETAAKVIEEAPKDGICSVKAVDDLTDAIRELHSSFAKCELFLTDLLMGAEAVKELLAVEGYKI